MCLSHFSTMYSEIYVQQRSISGGKEEEEKRNENKIHDDDDNDIVLGWRELREKLRDTQRPKNMKSENAKNREQCECICVWLRVLWLDDDFFLNKKMFMWHAICVSVFREENSFFFGVHKEGRTASHKYIRIAGVLCRWLFM